MPKMWFKKEAVEWREPSGKVTHPPFSIWVRFACMAQDSSKGTFNSKDLIQVYNLLQIKLSYSSPHSASLTLFVNINAIE